jgi:subtilisin-like proprotein convertase family protein
MRSSTFSDTWLALRLRSRVLAGLLAGLTVWLLVLAASPAAYAGPTFQHVSYSALPNDGDGVIAPGDAVTVQETVRNGSSQTLTGIQGTLTSADGSATINQGASAYPDLAPNASSANTTAFGLTLPSSADCGLNLPLNLHLSTPSQGSYDVPFTVTTGAPGAFAPWNSGQVPVPIPDAVSISQPASVTSSLPVTQPGRVKGVRVRIGHLTHTYDGDLLIELIAPDGLTKTTLINPNPANNGQNFVNTVFDQNAALPIGSAQAPYTGSFKPAGDLSIFNGMQQQGAWKLKITDTSPGNTGTLDSWGTDLAPANCLVTPSASFTATPNPAAVNAPVTFDGTGSVTPSVGATITNYAWDFTWGTSGHVMVSGPTVNQAFPTRAQVTAKLTVTDSLGNSGSTTQPVSVTQAPVASMSVSPGSPVAAAPVTFDASASTHDPDPAAHFTDYRWDLDGSGNYATDTGTTPTVTTSYPTSRTVSVHVRVTDDVGATSTAGQVVTIANQPPVAAFTGPSWALAGSAVTFDGSNSRDADGSVTGYAWDLAGTGTYSTDTGATPRVTTTYASAGTITVGLRVTDNQGATGTTSHTIQITRPPVARLAASPNPSSAGQQVTLDAGGSNAPDGIITSYRWDLDGSGSYATSSGSTPFLGHAFPAAGSYPVSVRVTDNYGVTSTASLTLTVGPATGGSGSPPPPPPPPAPRPGPAPAPRPTLPTTLGGDPLAGIASLSGTDLGAILPGSTNHFAAISGDAARRLGVIAAHGLTLNTLADRPATFQLTIQVTGADARRLKLVKGRSKKGVQPSLFVLGTATARLSAAGQKPFQVALSSRVRRALRRCHSTVQLLVSGTAVDAAGHQTALARAFMVKR